LGYRGEIGAKGGRVGGRAAGERESRRERLSGAIYRMCSLHKVFLRREQVGGDSKLI